MKISVIIPVYNVASQLDRCMESVTNQTYTDLEIIVINDGSTDSSGQICDEWSKKDARIKVIHQENSGQSKARNAGLEHATGAYIAFVDSDDWIPIDIYQHVIDLFNQYDCDVVDFQPLSVMNETDVKIEKNMKGRVEVVKGRDNILYDYMYKGQTQKSPFTVWRKVFRRELFQNIQFIEGMINEDIVINFELLMNAEILVTTDKIGYFYYQATVSTTRNGLRKRDFDLLKACDILKDLGTQLNNAEIHHLIEIKRARSYFSLLAKVAFYGVEDEMIDKKETIQHLTKNLRSNYSLLMKSPMPVNRKAMITALAINYNLLAVPLGMYKKLKARK